MIPELDLNEDERDLLAGARKFAQEVMLPRGKEAFESGEVPVDVLKQMAELGFQGIMAGEDWGGSGQSTRFYASLLEELSLADPTTATTLQVHVMVTDVYERFGTEAQKKEWLPRLTSGEILGAIAMTEPGAGSDLRNIRTTAVRDGDDYVINGQKTFITNTGTEISDGMIVLARTGEDDRGRGTFSVFIVPKDTPGFIKGQRLKKIGWKAMDTREIFFEDCRIPASNLMGEPERGLRTFMIGLDLGRTAFGAISVGLAQACLDYALEYAKERRQFGQAISDFQGTQFKFADMATKIEASRALVHDAARARDEGRADVQKRASMAKLFATRTATEVSDEAYQIFGGYGTSIEYPIARYYLDAKLMEIGEGTNEIQRVHIARSLGC